MTNAGLVERVAGQTVLKAVPREQIEWLVARGTLRELAAGEAMVLKGDPLRHLYVVLTGHMAIRVDRGSGARKVMEWFAGDVGGLLPYSRLATAPGHTTAEEWSELLAVDREHFPEMITHCHELTSVFVHLMLDRARRFTSSDFQDEKMRSLGRLSAGLAHELNNPASAVARSAKELSARLFELEATTLALGASQLSPEQLAAVARLRACCDDVVNAALTPLQRADREEALAAWLEQRGLGGDVGEALVESAIPIENLEPLAELLERDALGLALHTIGAGHRARRLAREIEVAAERVHTLVAAVKGFTYMDQTAVKKPIAIGQALADTLTMLGAKARTKAVMVTVHAAPDVPAIEGFGGELNQVWANLLDNAIDAVPASGHVEVRAERRDSNLLVRVVDDGPGVPAALVERIFEPFFTTKPQGKGTGLGLDVVRRVVREHNGTVEVESRPGRTEFRVILPPA